MKGNYSGEFPGGTSEFILTYGVDFNPAKKPVDFGWGEKQQCYANAYWLAFEKPSLIYCEGYALSSVVPIPIEHAWVVRRDGTVIDNTWRDDGAEYFGVPFQTEFVSKTIMNKETYGVFDDAKRGFPLIRTKLGRKPERWKHENFISR